MNIELRKWSVEDKEVLIKMCNSIDRSFLSDRLTNPYTNASAEWWLTMVKDNEGKKGVFREIVVDGKIVGTISVEQKDDVYRKDSEIGYYLLQEVYSKGIMSEAVRQICEIAFETLDIILILSRLVDTFFSRISPTMQLPPKYHSIAYVLPWAEVLHWQSRSSGCSNS